MKKISNKHYEAPQLSVDTFKVEEGFALSGVTSRFFYHEYNGDDDAYFGRDDYGTASTSDDTQQDWF